MPNEGPDKPDPDSYAVRLGDMVGSPKQTGKAAKNAPTPQEQAEAAAKRKSKTPDNDSFTGRLSDMAQGAEAEQTKLAEAAAKEAASAPDPDSYVVRLSALRGENEEAGEAPSPADEAASEQARPAGPVGRGEHVVSQGECMCSIANETGHFWGKIWNDPANAELREIRKNANVLLPGDRVTIPEIKPKEEPGETEIRHRFVRLGEPAMLRIQVREVVDQDDSNESMVDDDGTPIDQEQPRANTPYTIDIDGVTSTGTTGPDGYLQVPLPGNAQRAVLFIGDESHLEKYEFALGGVDPISELTGVQHRLNNLGLGCGTTDGQLGQHAQRALRQFQKQHSLPVTGEADDATRAKLVQEHGS